MVASKTSIAVAAAIALNAASTVYAAPIGFTGGADIAARGFEEDSFPLDARYYDDELEARGYFGDEDDELFARGYFDEEEELTARGYFDDEEELAARGYFDDEEELLARGYFDDEEELLARGYFDEDELLGRGYFDDDEYLLARDVTAVQQPPSSNPQTQPPSGNALPHPGSTTPLSTSNQPKVFAGTGSNIPSSPTSDPLHTGSLSNVNTPVGSAKYGDNLGPYGNVLAQTGSTGSSTPPNPQTHHHHHNHDKKHKHHHHHNPNDPTEQSEHHHHDKHHHHNGSPPPAIGGTQQNHIALAQGPGSTGASNGIVPNDFDDGLKQTTNTPAGPPSNTPFKKDPSLLVGNSNPSAPSTPGQSPPSSLTVTKQRRGFSDFVAGVFGKRDSGIPLQSFQPHRIDGVPGALGGIEAATASRNSKRDLGIVARHEHEHEHEHKQRKHEHDEEEDEHHHDHHHQTPYTGGATAQAPPPGGSPAPHPTKRDMVILARSLGLDDDYFLAARSLGDEFYEY